MRIAPRQEHAEVAGGRNVKAADPSRKFEGEAVMSEGGSSGLLLLELEDEPIALRRW